MKKVIRIREGARLQSHQVVLIVLAALVVAGSCLLLSAAESETLVDGAREWQVGSPLRAVVALLCLDYRWPTLFSGTVKVLVLNLGAGLVLAVLALAVALRGREAAGEAEGTEEVTLSEDEAAPIEVRKAAHIAPFWAAQVLVLLYLLWSLASSRWSAAPELAIGGTILLALQFVWALGLGHGLSARGAQLTGRAVVLVTVVTAAVAVWYFYGRNPVLRAKFPFGNPTFLATCLIPGLFLAGAWLWEALGAIRAGHGQRCWLAAVVAVLALGLGAWAFYLTGSRGPQVGLLFGALAAGFFALRGAQRIVPVAFALLIAMFVWQHIGAQAHSPSPTGRDASARLRLYAWSYAWEMFKAEPQTGYGQGGFVLAGDTHVVKDIERDPLPFPSRVAHAHSEWLEVLADLGAVGIVLLVGVLLLTLHAGMAALAAQPPPAERWTLIALMGALVGLVVEESFGVGLRVSGVPALFYTVIGLIWACSQPRGGGVVAWLAGRPGRRGVGAAICGLAALGATLIALQDFAAARSAYSARAALEVGDYEQAIRLAQSGQSRLNPQRALANWFRLSQAHMLIAQQLQQRAAVRTERAAQVDPPDLTLLGLAEQDYAASEEHCTQGLRALKELVSRAPGFLHHGQLEYDLNLIRMRNPAAYRDPNTQALLLENARSAIERELRRQPYSTALTLDYLRVAWRELSLPEIMEVLARPLRHDRMTRVYLEFLDDLARMGIAEFEPQFAQLVEQARAALPEFEPPVIRRNAEQEEEGREDQAHRWAPEELRLAATIFFWQGKYEQARQVLEEAREAYDKLAPTAPFGAAAFYLELADTRFNHQPDQPELALTAAREALRLAPVSQRGRHLSLVVKGRMVAYHLAHDAEAEAEAGALLRQLAPPSVTDEEIRYELGVHYGRLCYELLQRRMGSMRLPPSELPAKFSRWVARAVELAPHNPLAHFIAADLAVRNRECEPAAAHIQQALEHGLAEEEATVFLQAACAVLRDCAPLRELLLTMPVPDRPPLPAATPPALPASDDLPPPADAGDVETEAEASPPAPSTPGNPPPAEVPPAALPAP